MALSKTGSHITQTRVCFLQKQVEFYSHILPTQVPALQLPFLSHANCPASPALRDCSRTLQNLRPDDGNRYILRNLVLENQKRYTLSKDMQQPRQTHKVVTEVSLSGDLH